MSAQRRAQTRIAFAIRVVRGPDRTLAVLGSSTNRVFPVLTVSALIGALLVQPAHAELCAARVELEGDPAVIGMVTTELARLGVERGRPAPGCRGVFAQVETDRDGAIAVAIRDGARRSEGRVVGDAAIAASWIDSWLHDDLDGRAWLLAAPVQVATAAPTVAQPPAPRDTPRVSSSQSVLERGAITVGYEHALLDDGASANGIGASACVMFRGVCVGLRGQYTREPDRTTSTGLTAMARGDASIAAIARLPMRTGRMTIAPELGLGVGRMSTRRIEGCAPANTIPGDPNCDPMDPMCQPVPTSCMDPSGMDPSGKVFVGDNFATATITPRFSAGVRIAVPLFDHVWLDGSAGYTLAPFGHGDAHGVSPQQQINPDGTIMPSTGTEFALPGEPGGGFQLGIGLRIGSGGGGK